MPTTKIRNRMINSAIIANNGSLSVEISDGRIIPVSDIETNTTTPESIISSLFGECFIFVFQH